MHLKKKQKQPYMVSFSTFTCTNPESLLHSDSPLCRQDLLLTSQDASYMQEVTNISILVHTHEFLSLL